MSCVIIKLLTIQDGDWTIIIHPRHGSKDYDKKHVHISKRLMKGEYSWNIDGTRHDRHKFPKSEQCINRAKALAANALKISPKNLQYLSNFDGGVFVHIQDNLNTVHRQRIFSSYVHKEKYIVILGSNNGLVVVIDHI